MDCDDFLGEEQKQRILVEFNNTSAYYPREKTIHELFSEQVRKSPDRIAAVFEGAKITYRELDCKSNLLAALLKKAGVQKGSVVGFMLPRSIDMVMGIIGILKAGAVCLPLDLKYPRERITMILEDSGAKVLLKSESLGNTALFRGTIIDFDPQMPELQSDDAFSLTEQQDTEQLKDSDSLAYLVYTSGSTGKPKGVLLRHLGINNHAFTKIKELELNCDDVVCHNLSVNFVASIWLVFAPLFIGAKVVIYSEDVINNPYELFKKAAEDKASVLEIVPSLLDSYLRLLDEGKEAINLSCLKVLVLTGEKVTPLLVNRFYKKYKTSLVNAYGQSECSDDTLHYKIPYNIETKAVPIGKPSNNTFAYILDENNSLKPVGEIGELCISGDGLSAGYLNEPELTAGKFVPNPFINVQLERNHCQASIVNCQLVFRTGDLTRWLADGNIEYIGRVDHQVKIRGFRIEPGEIETEILKFEQVKGAVVTAWEGKQGENQLCAYIVAQADLEMAALREYLSRRLPEYMIPAYFLRLDKLPLTPNGKTDRKSLPDPDANINTAMDYHEPESEIEEKLQRIWCEVLDLDTVGVYTSFLEAGGHSLKGAVLAFRIQKQLGAEIPLSTIFKLKTIRALAKHIESVQHTYTSIEPVEEREYYMLSPAQKRLFILSQTEGVSTSYNMPIALIIEGSLNVGRLENAFNELVKNHEALRTSFITVNGEPVQRIHAKAQLKISYVQSEKDKIDYLINEFTQPFDLSEAPLLRVQLVKTGEKRHILVLDMHHIISDGASVNIIIKEFIDLYEGREIQKPKIQYKEFTAWQDKLFKCDAFIKQEKYWMNVFAREIPALDMPSDYPRPPVQSFGGDSVHLELGQGLTGQLQRLGRETGTTLFMVLLGAYYALLLKYTGQEDIVVGTPVAGRRHADLEHVVGMFVNTLAIRCKPKGEETFEEFLKEVGENTLKAYENQDYQFDMILDKIQFKRDLSRNPLFDTCFTFISRENYEFRTKGEFNIKPYSFRVKATVFDLLFVVFETELGLNLVLEYLTALFGRPTAQKIAEHYIEILKQVAEDKSIKLTNIKISQNLLTAAEARTDTGDFGF